MLKSMSQHADPESIYSRLAGIGDAIHVVAVPGDHPRVVPGVCGFPFDHLKPTTRSNL